MPYVSQDKIPNNNLGRFIMYKQGLSTVKDYDDFDDSLNKIKECLIM